MYSIPLVFENTIQEEIERQKVLNDEFVHYTQLHFTLL